MEDGLVPDGHQLSDVGAVVVREVDDRAVLHVGTRADDDPVDVAPQHRLEPDTRFFRQGHIAEDIRAGSDEGGGMDRGALSEKALQLLGQIHGEMVRRWRGNAIREMRARRNFRVSAKYERKLLTSI